MPSASNSPPFLSSRPSRTTPNGPCGPGRRRSRASGLTCFDGFLKTLHRYWEPITNYFVDLLTSGFVEGFNNKLKVLKRRCYGLTNLDHLFQRIFLDLEGYRLFA